MSIQGLQPLPIDVFSGLVTDIPPSDLPLGSSPANQDVQYKMGAWETRPARLRVFPQSFPGFPAINGLANYTNTNLVDQLLALDANGNLYSETSFGSDVPATISSGLQPNAIMNAKQGFGRAYMGFSQSGLGADIPRQWDGTNFDRVSQSGPGAAPTAADSTTFGHISAGVHQVTVFFRTRQGFNTAPAPPTMWNSAGGLAVTISNIPIGPPNVIARVICFTAAGLANFFYIANATVINDNTTTTTQIDFADSALLSGTNVDEYFNRVALGQCAGFAIYSDRLFGFAERNKLDNFLNMAFDGGFSSAGYPLGWTQDPTFGAGGSPSPTPYFGGSYRITSAGDGSSVGMITQPAVIDSFGQMTLLQVNTSYSVRVKLATSSVPAGLVSNVAFAIHSPTAGTLGFGLIPSNAITGSYQGFSVQILTPQASIPNDAVLQVYVQGFQLGAWFDFDEIEIFPTLTPYRQTYVSASLAGQPEAFDGETGNLQPEDAGDQIIMGGFQLRKLFYLVGQNWLGTTQDDKTNEPSLWDISEVSNEVGTPSPNGIGIGEEWAVIASRNGLYIVWGGNEPIKLSQEIQPTWDTINWEAGYSLWVSVNVTEKRILIGVPTGTATSPNKILYFDYRGLDTATDIASYHSVRYSSYSGKILAIGDARKWSVWDITASSGALIERPDGTQHTFLGSGGGTVNSGLIWDMLDVDDFPAGTPYSDDGAGIAFSYSTYYTPGHIDEQQLQLGAGIKRYGYLRGFVEGDGSLFCTAQALGNLTPVKLATLNLVTADPQPIASWQILNGIATIVTSSPHELLSTDTQAVFAGTNGIDGTWPIQVIVNPTTFKIYLNQPNASGNGGTANRLLRDFEMTTNAVGERVSYTFTGDGQPGTWARMQKLIPYMKPEPWATVRGAP